MDHLTDAEYEEEVRCAALGLEGPNAKSFRATSWLDHADRLHKLQKEQGLHSVDVSHHPQRGYLAKVYSEPGNYGMRWIAEIHRDLPQGTEMLSELVALSRESVIEKARVYVEALKQPVEDPEWIRL